MHWFGHFRSSNAASDGERDQEAADKAAEDRLAKLAADLFRAVQSVTPAEFTWQEAHYDHDSRLGRELLFLMANYDWVRATSEIVDITRSDTIETTIKIDVDLSQVTHEAFRKRTGPIWLPVAVLPPYIRRDGPALPAEADTGPREPDLFATVTDAAGKPVPMMPTAELQHEISAAMAEIIAKMAVSYMPADDKPANGQPANGQPANGQPTAGAVATRDQRLLLSAAIYRVLRQGSDEESEPTESDSPIDSPRLSQARKELLWIVGYFNRQLVSLTGDKQARTRSDHTLPAELARRAVKVLLALRESLIVVVLMDYLPAPSVLSVRVPPRTLTVSSSSLLKPWTWIIRPVGRLEIAVLLATADADRQIQVNLPDGVSVDRRANGGANGPSVPWLDMTVHTPLPLQDLSVALAQVVTAQDNVKGEGWPIALVRPFMDLVRVSAAEAVDVLRHYELTYRPKRAVSPPADAVADPPPETAPEPARSGGPTDPPQGPPKKEKLLSALWHVATDQDWQSDTFQGHLATAQRAFATDKPSLSRQIKLNVVNAQTITGRLNITEDIPQRAIPRQATVSADVTVEDRDYFATARSSATMSLILMLVVLGFLLGWHAVNPKAPGPAAEVLAIVLTLFATTQADRIERPDRSTLRGRLYTIGNWLIAASVLPALTLAIALGFQARGMAADYWAIGCVAAQLYLLLVMQSWPLIPAGWHGFGQRRVLSTAIPDYRHFEALRSDYWRDTTAEALTIGRKAYGYIVWQKADPEVPGEAMSPKLLPLLAWRGALPTEASSVLALLRTGTLRQAVTFIVFRGQPDEDEWPAEGNGGNGRPTDDKLASSPLELSPGRLTPATGVSRMVDLFFGVSRDEMLTIAEHPVTIAMKKAAGKLTVLDAQLPVPPPVSGHDDKHWARVRLALRDSADIHRLTTFLKELHAAMRRPENARHVVAIQATPAAVPNVIAGPPGAEKPPAEDGNHLPRWLRTSDLDLVNGAAIDNEMPTARTWRVLAICADARSKIESDILVNLAKARPDVQLGGLTYALLYGTAVMVLFVHEPPGSKPEPADDSAGKLQAQMQENPGCDKLRVLLSRRLSQDDMEPVVEYAYPILHVYFRWQDRPGATLNVLDSISTALREALRRSHGKDSPPPNHAMDWSVSYARLRVLTGQVATARLTIRMHIPEQDIEGWTAERLEETARNIEFLAAAAAANQAAAARNTPGASADALSAPEEPVVRVDRIKLI